MATANTILSIAQRSGRTDCFEPTVNETRNALVHGLKKRSGYQMTLEASNLSHKKTLGRCPRVFVKIYFVLIAQRLGDRGIRDHQLLFASASCLWRKPHPGWH